MSPAPGDLNQFNLKNGHTEGASDLFGKTLEHIKRLKPAKPAEDETAQNARKVAVPRKPGVTRKLVSFYYFHYKFNQLTVLC